MVRPPTVGTAALAPPLTTPVEVPRHLRPETAEWFAAVTGAWEITAAKRRLLEAACTAWDVAEVSRETITRDGMMITMPDGSRRAHPLLVTMRTARQQFASLLSQLDLDDGDEG